jgi:Fe-S-cluster containining protein
MRHDARTHCIRCGECCLRSSPTLQAEDRPLIKAGPLERNDLITIRKGDLVRDPVNAAVGPAAFEYIKIKEKKGTERGCIFYDGTARACTIYDDRPLQCRALTCWDTRKIVEVLEQPKLRRQDVVHDGVLSGLMDEHEKRCSYKVLHSHIISIVGEGNRAVERIIDLLRFDYQFRPFISEKLNIPMDEMDFYLGRPIVDTIRNYGLQVKREPDGSFFLTQMSEKGKDGLLE